MSDLLPVGSLVQVCTFDGDRYAAKVVGYDMFGSKYRLAKSILGGTAFTDSIAWAFPDEVSVLATEPDTVNCSRVVDGVSVPRVHTGVTQYTVSCVPDEHDDRLHFEIIVEYRGRGRWAVMRLSRCLGRDGSWSYDSLPSNREEEWLAQYRFTETEAVRLAQEWAPKLTCNGMTVNDALAVPSREL